MTPPAALFRLLPHQCPLCLNHCNDYLCRPCRESLPYIGTACSVCALPLATSDSVCGDCLTQDKPYRQTVCPLAYRHPVDHLMREFKERRPLVAAHALLPPLLQLLEQRYGSDSWPDALVPVPMHWSKRLRRGFNQAHILSQLLSKATGVPCRTLLQRPLRSHNQKGLTRKQRLVNLQHAFICNGRPEGAHVAIIDDVVTTGATAIAAAQTLTRAGAGPIDVWALARTPAQ